MTKRNSNYVQKHNTSVRSSRARALKILSMSALAAVTAMVVRHRAKQAEHANPPMGQFLQIDGVRLHYVERGEGEPLVLLHGNGTMIQDLAASGLLEQAAERYRVIMFDRPGYGYSTRPRNKLWTPSAQAELLHKALEQLGIKRPVVMGHSWGTLVALALGLKYPADVRSLVLLSGYYFPSVRLDILLSSPPAIPIIGDIMRYTISPLLGRLLWPVVVRRLFAPASVPSRFGAFPLGMALRPSQLRASAGESALLIPAATGLRRRYRELTVPVVIMTGVEDKIVDAARHSARLHRELPQSNLHLVPGVGHMIHHIVPHQVMRAIDVAARAA